MKKLAFIKRAEALRLRDSTPGAYSYPYCTGKYKTPVADLLGNQVCVSDNVIAVYAERRSDQFGAYTKQMCVAVPQR